MSMLFKNFTFHILPGCADNEQLTREIYLHGGTIALTINRNDFAKWNRLDMFLALCDEHSMPDWPDLRPIHYRYVYDSIAKGKLLSQVDYYLKYSSRAKPVRGSQYTIEEDRKLVDHITKLAYEGFPLHELMSIRTYRNLLDFPGRNERSLYVRATRRIIPYLIQASIAVNRDITQRDYRQERLNDDRAFLTFIANACRNRKALTLEVFEDYVNSDIDNYERFAAPILVKHIRKLYRLPALHRRRSYTITANDALTRFHTLLYGKPRTLEPLVNEILELNYPVQPGFFPVSRKTLYLFLRRRKFHPDFSLDEIGLDSNTPKEFRDYVLGSSRSNVTALPARDLAAEAESPSAFNSDSEASGDTFYSFTMFNEYSINESVHQKIIDAYKETKQITEEQLKDLPLLSDSEVYTTANEDNESPAEDDLMSQSGESDIPSLPSLDDFSEYEQADSKVDLDLDSDSNINTLRTTQEDTDIDDSDNDDDYDAKNTPERLLDSQREPFEEWVNILSRAYNVPRMDVLMLTHCCRTIRDLTGAAVMRYSKNSQFPVLKGCFSPEDDQIILQGKISADYRRIRQLHGDEQIEKRALFLSTEGPNPLSLSRLSQNL
ncbi:hypothetical protein CANCADRAFT_71780 [Tortispora caseinolytica NRRL Y-17796]|uniref:TRF2-interacting telomeric protein/Rap1 C-terminal domain-containing protein n=1 Tax=Tortispora caseinolytica NRRL Y-17796 TaxID=767744 RepID=A0A1E4TIE5_9ASCO|nr:hypothetical protein CANCADRAFT_71780 [Tortispora caseinolytica NRRL Y-17796]